MAGDGTSQKRSGRNRFRVEFLEDGVLLLDSTLGTVSRCSWALIDEVRAGAASGLSPEHHEALLRALKDEGGLAPVSRRRVVLAGAGSVIASSTLLLPGAARAASADLAAGSGWVTGTTYYDFVNSSGATTGTEWTNGVDSPRGYIGLLVGDMASVGGSLYRCQILLQGENGAGAAGGAGMSIIANLTIDSNSWDALEPAFGVATPGGNRGGWAAGAFLEDPFAPAYQWVAAAAGGGGAGQSSAGGDGGAGGRAFFQTGRTGSDGSGSSPGIGGGGASGLTPGAGASGPAGSGIAGTARTGSAPSGGQYDALGTGGGATNSAARGGGGGAGWAGGGGGGSAGFDGGGGGGGGGSSYIWSGATVDAYDQVLAGRQSGTGALARFYI